MTESHKKSAGYSGGYTSDSESNRELSRRERAKIERRETVLVAAETLFRRTAFDKVTIDAIADEADLAKGSVYQYFDSKDALYLELMTRWLKKMEQELIAAAENQPNGLNALRAMIHRRLEIVAAKEGQAFENALRWALVRDHDVAKSERPPPAIRECVWRLLSLHVESIQHGQQEGLIRNDYSPTVLAQFVIASTLGVLLHQQKFHLPMEQLSSSYSVDLLISALKTNPNLSRK